MCLWCVDAEEDYVHHYTDHIQQEKLQDIRNRILSKSITMLQEHQRERESPLLDDFTSSADWSSSEYLCTNTNLCMDKNSIGVVFVDKRKIKCILNSYKKPI